MTDDAVKVDLEFKIKNLSEVIKQIEDALKDIPDKFVKEMDSKIQGNLKTSPSLSNKAQKSEEDEKEKTDKLLGGMSEATNKIADAGISILQGVFGLVEQIFQRIKKASPLLEAIETLFNLAWTLFFMPLGNKLGEVLIPSVIQLVDGVMDIWDAFEGMSIGEMFEYAITKGVALLSTFLLNIGETLSSEKGIIGSISRFLTNMGKFIESHGAKLLETLFNLTAWILENIPALIGTLVALKIASIGLQVTQIAVSMAGPLAGLVGLGITAGLSLGAGSAVSKLLSGQSITGYADGGYVPATPGGQLAIVGEGGEGEYIFPESKVSNMGGNYTINNYMMSTDELDRHIREVVRGEVSASKLRSGF